MAKSKKEASKKVKTQTTKTQPETIASKTDDTKLFAFLATFLSIVGFIIAIATKKEDKYVMHYAKQSLVLFIAWVIIAIITIPIKLIPVIGWIIWWVLYVLMTILWILSWVYALSGKEKIVPVIGQYAEKINL
jgi:uncharacterized membrane protein